MQVLTTAPPRHALPTGAIVPLVSLLDGKEGPEAQEAAAGALLCLADHEGARLAITEADGIGWLVMLLGCENPRARQHAEGALVRLSISVSNRVLIIKKLVDMLQDAGTSAQEQAAAALAKLARESADNRKSIVDANGIVPLLELLDSTSMKAKENAAAAITQLVRKGVESSSQQEKLSKDNQSVIAKAGGIEKLVGVLIGLQVIALIASDCIRLQVREWRGRLPGDPSRRRLHLIESDCT
jgi:vacuolar protein 8